MARPAVVEVNLDAVLANYQLACDLSPRSKNIAVVKANAYGHGALNVCKHLAPHVPAFAVAAIEEAIEIRESGIEKPILLLEGIFSPEELEIAAHHNFWLMVENLKQVEAICSAPQKCPLTLWIKIDTGMHRLGLNKAELDHAMSTLPTCGWVNRDIVIASHFYCADEPEKSATNDQIALFQTLTQEYPNASKSLANSAGILAHPRSHLDWNRPGYMLYGGHSVKNAASQKIQATMTLKSAVISIRDVPVGDTVGYGASWTAQRPSKIATVAIGYGDGYPRQLANGTPVIIKGKRASLAGRVSMDMITVDVTDINDVNIGDAVILWGEDLPIDELADLAGTIGYELITRMTGRVAIKYTNND